MEADVEGVVDVESNKEKYAASTLPASVIANHVNEIRGAADDGSNDDDLAVGGEDEITTATEEASEETFLTREIVATPLIISKPC